MFVLLQGKRAGPAAHARYFQLKGWSAGQREKFVDDHAAAYTRYVSEPLLHKSKLLIHETASAFQQLSSRQSQSQTFSLPSPTRLALRCGLLTWRSTVALLLVPRRLRLV